MKNDLQSGNATDDWLSTRDELELHVIVNLAFDRPIETRISNGRPLILLRAIKTAMSSSRLKGIWNGPIPSQMSVIARQDLREFAAREQIPEFMALCERWDALRPRMAASILGAGTNKMPQSEIDNWYLPYVARNVEAGKIPNRNDDIAAAKAWCSRVIDKQVRDARRRLAPTAWTDKGRRPGKLEKK
jgi:hypothetical protein